MRLPDLTQASQKCINQGGAIPLIDRAMKHVEKTETCWLWQGPLNKNGYGNYVMGFMGKIYGWLAHRFIYEQLVGEIPEGLTLDHTCKVRRCVNPKHLEPVTLLENISRGDHANRTHCKRGHPLTPENTYNNGRNGAKHRDCKMCIKIRVEGYKRSRKELNV